MKKYLKVLIVLMVAAVLGGAAWLTNILLYCPFLPEAVSAGAENYAVVHKISDKWVVSVIDKFGEEVQHTDFPSDDKSEQIKLIYSDEMYYLWRYNPETGRAFVNNIIYGEISEKENEVVLKAKTGETFFGVNGSDETISAVGVMEQDGMAEITVYLAGITAPEFKVSETYSFRGEFLIRDALYCPDGSVMFLTADGIIYRITNQDRIPRVYYNCAENVPQSLMLDGSGKLCVWNSDNRAFRINEDKITEPCLEDMISELVYNDAVHSLNECISVSVQSDDFSAVIHEKNDGALCLETYCNGMLYTKSETDYVSWWKYVLVYLLIILAVMIISVLLMSVRLLLRDTVKMKTRLLVLCVAGFCIVASVVTVYTVSVFTAQKTEQKWERLTIMLNQMSIFLHADEQTDYQWLINEKQGLTAEQHQLVEKLETMSENKTEGQSTFILFVRDENGKYISVSGSEEYINKAPELIYTPSAGYRITDNSDSDENLLSLNYRKGGALWMMMVQKLYTVSEQTEISEPSALLVMQMPAFIEPDMKMYFADALLLVTVAGFVVLLLIRTGRIMRPLRQMEIQAQRFTADETCDIVVEKGHNEITLLTRSFNQAVQQLKTGLEKGRLSAQAYGRFVPKEWLMQMGVENLSSLTPGKMVEKEMAILYLKCDTVTKTEETVNRRFYEMIFEAIKQYNGIPESLSPENIRILFPENSFGAVCTASMIREAFDGQYDMNAYVDYGKTKLWIFGDNEHSGICSEIESETIRLPLLKRISEEFGCSVLISGKASEHIIDFGRIFNSRTIGFFSDQQQDKPMHVIEILTQRPSDAFEQGVHFYHIQKYADAFSLFSEALQKNPTDSAAVRYLYLCHKALTDAGK